MIKFTNKYKINLQLLNQKLNFMYEKKQTKYLSLYSRLICFKQIKVHC